MLNIIIKINNQVFTNSLLGKSPLERFLININKIQNINNIYLLKEEEISETNNIQNIFGNTQLINNLEDIKNTQSNYLMFDSVYPLLAPSTINKLIESNTHSKLNKTFIYYFCEINNIKQDLKNILNTELNIIQPASTEEVLNTSINSNIGIITQIINQYSINKLQEEGVIFQAPNSCYIAPEVKIQSNTFIEHSVTITGNTIIHSNNIIKSHTVISDSEIYSNCTIGPFAHLRDNNIIHENCRIGNFVELKNSQVNKNTNISHLSYIGDAELGSEVNIGAGTITANFNSVTGKKNKTILKDKVKTGSNSVLVAPIEIAENNIIAAGSVITDSVDTSDNLLIARCKQSVKNNWLK